ncbi:hypothetical protein HMPREF0671_08755 [Prevotella sp. S7 MS 2]|nr:hypothetical protein HMPREF0671_08755 [Prevotella sp. S7 MS 2]
MILDYILNKISSNNRPLSAYIYYFVFKTNYIHHEYKQLYHHKRISTCKKIYLHGDSIYSKP